MLNRLICGPLKKYLRGFYLAFSSRLELFICIGVLVMETETTFKDKSGLIHVVLAILAFVGIASLTPVLRIIQVLLGA